MEYTFHFKVFKSKLLSKDNENTLEELLKNEVIPYFQDQQVWFYVAKYSEILAEHYAQHFKYKASTHYYHLINEAQKKIY